MSAPALRLHNSRPLLQDILAPFLFHTRTLLRAYSNTEKHASSSRGQRLGPGPSGRGSRYVGARRDDGRLSSAKAQSRSFPLNSQSPDRKADETLSVPFEGDAMAKLENSTMTPKEYYKFETLIRKKTKAQVAAPQAQIIGEGHQATSFAQSVFPEPLRGLAKEAEEMRKQSHREASNVESTSSEVTDAALLRMKRRMNAAATDVALWNILQNDVLSQIATSQQSEKLQGNGTFHEPTTNMRLLLVHFMIRIRAHFQGSPFGLMLLPSLKKLGPSAFALTATTDLYNEHMHILYRHSCDVHGVVQILSEMDQEVYEYNQGTKDLVASVLAHAHASMRGHKGRGQQALWLTDRKARLIEKLERCNQVVDMRLSSAAMKKARARSADIA